MATFAGRGAFLCNSLPEATTQLIRKSPLATVNLTVATIALLATSVASEALARPARCVIMSVTGSVGFKGPCDFIPMRGNGGFSISPIGAKTFFGAMYISVGKTSLETAEVRGLTPSGVNSRWGDYRRSKRDPACWESTGTRICVY